MPARVALVSMAGSGWLDAARCGNAALDRYRGRVGVGLGSSTALKGPEHPVTALNAVSRLTGQLKHTLRYEIVDQTDLSRPTLHIALSDFALPVGALREHVANHQTVAADPARHA